jgi:catechol 2,3-dioxygenase-like lactoylglutathione lyase family enzyme
MGFHHVALATKDPVATHTFYTEVMGFELVKVIAAPTPGGTGWAKHFFFDTGRAGDGGMLAFWDINDEVVGRDWNADLSHSLGLPSWVNHLAWDAPTLDDLAAHREHWRGHGITVAEIDHGFCTSIYATDPNGILVEFCCDTAGLSEEDAVEAERLLRDPKPELEADPPIVVHRALTPSA